MPAMRRLAALNKVAANRVVKLWAPYVPPWAVLVHEGRKSGRRYATPVAASVRNGVLRVRIAYGPETEWAKNLVAAGGGYLRRRGKWFRLSQTEVVDRGTGRTLRAMVEPMSPDETEQARKANAGG